MFYCDYNAGFTVLRMKSDGIYLTGLNFLSAKEEQTCRDSDIPVLQDARKWLDIYFSGAEPKFIPKIKLTGTEFQMRVWKLLREIPFGATVTYGELAKKIAEETGKEKMSAQAVGGAAGKNPVGIIVPCHRVIGCGGKLVGFAGGIEVKKRLLELEIRSIKGKTNIGAIY